MNRPAFNEAVQYLKRKNAKTKYITHFIVSEASRISRPDRLIEAFMMEDKIKTTGVKIVKANAPDIDDTTEFGEVMNTFQYVFSKYEKVRSAGRFFDGRVKKLEEGYRPFRRPPLGYTRTKLSTKHYCDEIDPLK